MNASCRPPPIKLAVASAALLPQVADLLALQRLEEPETPVSLIEVFSNGILLDVESGQYDLAIAWKTSTSASALSVRILWRDELVAVVPVRSPLLAHGRIPSAALRHYPLIYWCPQSCQDALNQQIGVQGEAPPGKSGPAASFELMTIMVAAGYSVGIAPRSRVEHARNPGILMRALAGDSPWVETCLFWRAGPMPPTVERFAERASRVAAVRNE